jgi:hypothetical protein
MALGILWNGCRLPGMIADGGRGSVAPAWRSSTSRRHGPGSGPPRTMPLLGAWSRSGPTRRGPDGQTAQCARGLKARLVHSGSVARQSASQAASRRRSSARWASWPTHSTIERVERCLVDCRAVAEVRAGERCT